MTLYELLMRDDIQIVKIARMEGLQELQEELKEGLSELAQALEENVTTRMAEINSHVTEVSGHLRTIYGAAENESRARVLDMHRDAKKLFKKVGCRPPPPLDGATVTAPETLPMPLKDALEYVDDFEKKMEAAREQLMTMETNVQGSVFQLVDEFEDNFSALMSALSEIMAEFFQSALLKQNAFHESLTALAAQVLVKFSAEMNEANDVDDFPPEDQDDEEGENDDDYELLLSNMDALMEVVNGSHEKHESMILGFDQSVRDTIKKDAKQTVATFKETEFARSRKVVTDIEHLTEGCGEPQSAKKGEFKLCADSARVALEKSQAIIDDDQRD